MAGRKFNFAAAEKPAGTAQGEKKESPPRETKKDRQGNKTSDTQATPTTPDMPEPNGTLAGKAGTLSRKISSSPEPKSFDFRFIPRNKLQFYEGNEYTQENIESLAEKILDMGLIHNLEVFYVLETDSYIIDSGERRCRALDMLINHYKDYKNQKDQDYKKYLLHVKQFENGYPCKVILSLGNEELDRLDLRIRHYIANEETRDRDPAKTAKHIAELNTLYALRNSSSGERININKKIGEDLGLSDRQVKKYKSVQKLIPELQKKFEENEITLTDGSSYAALSTEEQEELLKLINSGASKKKVDELYQSISAMKKDIASKENEIKSLENEKEAAQEEIRKAQAEITSLQKKLEKESAKGNPEQDKLNMLKEQIEETEKKMERQLKHHQKSLKYKDSQIETLRKRLKERESSNDLPDERAAAKLNLQIEHLKETSETLRKCYEEYERTYQEGAQTAPPPEKYKEEIKQILEGATRMLK